MQLPLQSFPTIVGNAVAAVQGSARQLLDLSVGSTLRAILEANASLALWLQWLIVQVLQMTRAATSNGVDLDSWMADFSVTRLPASTAAGHVTFARFNAGANATIPVGTVVRTGDGSQSFAVTGDPSNPAWQSSAGYYVMPVGLAALTVPVQALTAGAAGNVQVGTVSLIAAALPGVDTVTNQAALSGGVDAETDAALRLRFPLFLQSLARATPLAIEAAVVGIRQGLSCVVSENMTPDGSARQGSFVVTVDDGSGNPPATVLTAAAQAIENVRPIGSSFAVRPPGIVSVAVELSITVSPPAVHPEIAGKVSSALQAFVNALPIGAVLSVSRLAQIAFNADPSVSNVTGLQINGSFMDIDPGRSNVIKLFSMQVS